jgi:hypothetical protein
MTKRVMGTGTGGTTESESFNLNSAVGDSRGLIDGRIRREQWYRSNDFVGAGWSLVG